MADTLTEDQRQRVMSANRPTGRKTTEWALRSRLAAAGISGWRINASEIVGKPDFVFPETQLAVFVDGCFWHGCPDHGSMPETNREFWESKLYRNRTRDEFVTDELEDEGWRVLRFWEHELKDQPSSVVEEIQEALSTR